ncbi:MAG TPA: hypothetical protein VLA77_00745 [Candidatus Saccharimonadales bacterium]|nr:hypothetical protein [Candidatus Saccharimonadales bacterium]
MKSFLQKAAQTLMIAPLLVLGLSFVVPVAVNAGPTPTTTTTCNAANPDISQGPAGGAECVRPSADTQLFGSTGIFVIVTNILIFIIGSIAVIMLIIGGIRYTVSQGDQNAITSAKNTILYAIIGIVVAVLAFGAVQFVTNELT